MKIQYVNAVCGAGKTTALIEYVKNNPSEFFIFTAETKLLCDQISFDFKKHGITPVICHRDVLDQHQSVLQYLMKALNDKERVIVCTKASLGQLPFVPCSGMYNLIEDEIPTVFDYHKISKPASHTHYMPLFKTTSYAWSSIDTCVMELSGHTNTLSTIFNHGSAQQDAVALNVYSVWWQCRSSAWDVITKKQYWDEFSTDPAAPLVALSVMKPDFYMQFKSVTISGANFDSSLLYTWWKHRHPGIEWVEHPITQKITHRNNHNNLKNRVNIKFLQSHDVSKTQFGKITDGKTLIQKYADQVCAAFEGEKFLFVANNAYENIQLPENGVRINVKAHGINKYQHITNIAFLPALNLEPMAVGIMTSIGLTDPMRKAAIGIETAYQSVMRTALRDRQSNEVINIIVGDKATADGLAKIFGGATVIDQANNVKTYTTRIKSNDRTSYEKWNQIQKILLKTQQSSLSEIANRVHEKTTTQTHESSVFVNYPIRGFVEHQEIDQNIQTKMPIFSNRFSSDLFDESKTQYFDYDSHKSFLDLLEESAKHVKIADKGDSMLFSIGSYDFPPLPEIYEQLIQNSGRRGKANVKCAPNLVLDFDGGDISRFELTQIFKDIGYQFYICNSFSRKKTGDNLFSNNYRVFIPLSHLVIQETYTNIYMHFAKLLNDRGFNTQIQKKNGWVFPHDKLTNPKNSGLDVSKIGMESMMYLPCTNINEPEAAFFDKFYVNFPQKRFNVQQFCNSQITHQSKLSLVELVEEVDEVVKVEKSETIKTKPKLTLDQIWDRFDWNDGKRHLSSYGFGAKCREYEYSEWDTINHLKFQLNSTNMNSKIQNCKNGWRGK